MIFAMKNSIDFGSRSQLNAHDTIECPSCGHNFELSEALTGRIREHLKGELLEEVTRREKELKKTSDKLKAEQDAVTRARESLDDEVAKKLQLRLKEVEGKAVKQAEERLSHQLKEMQETLKEREAALQSLRANELELRKQKRQLEAAQQDFDLTVLRKVEEETKKVRKSIEEGIFQQHRVKDLEKDKLIDDLKNSLEDMKRKAELRSMQLQGEVMELDFEDRLGSYFRQDSIQPVPKGVSGADLIQNVRTTTGAECGIILWEAKNTKSWSNQWIPKLKEDMITVRASLAILVSVVLPEGVKRFGLVDGVWVCDPASALPLATALRQQLVAVNCERQSQIGKAEKMETLYRYLAGTEFKQKIEGIIEAFMSMHGQIQKERRAMEKQWSEREKQIARVLRSTSALYGDMQGIIGGDIPIIPSLELDEPSPKELPAASAEEDDEFVTVK